MSSSTIGMDKSSWDTRRELNTHTHTPTLGSHLRGGHTDLVPEGDLPGVPAGDPRGEQSLHVAQEDHAVDPVVLTAGLLMETEIGGGEKPYVCVWPQLAMFAQTPANISVRDVIFMMLIQISLRLERDDNVILGDPLNITPPPPALTWRTAPERGSMMRSFLSLQLVASRPPSVLKDMLRTTSVWQSIIFTGSPISKFQIRICQDQQGLCRWRGL